MESKRLHGERKQRNECMLCLFAMLFLGFSPLFSACFASMWPAQGAGGFRPHGDVRSSHAATRP